jgi:hypothetical protein
MYFLSIQAVCAWFLIGVYAEAGVARAREGGNEYERSIERVVGCRRRLSLLLFMMRIGSA